MILYSILLAIGLLIILILSLPIRIRFESRPSCLIKWIFIKVHITMHQGSLQAEYRIFNKPVFTKPKKNKQKKPSKPSKKKKTKLKITAAKAIELLNDSAVKKILRSLFRLLYRLVMAVRINFLKWEIGMRDYYQQGIIMGLLSAIPETDCIQVNGNFEEINDILLIIDISLWRLVFAITPFFIGFPYISVFRLYRNLR